LLKRHISNKIGIAAFFLKKFNKNKPANYQRPPSSTSEKRPFSATEINVDDSGDKRGSRARSAKSGKSFNVYQINSIVYIDDSGSLSDHDDFAYATLQAVNAVRQRYNAQPVEVNDQLSIIAQGWADQMARTGKLEHSPAEHRHFGRQTLGENYAAVFQKELTGHYFVKKTISIFFFF
jgi:uncharacterized protein YkwD